MDFWLISQFVSLQDMVPVAKQAEAAGFTGIALADHLCVPSKISSVYPYGEPADRPLLDSSFEISGSTGDDCRDGERTSRLQFTTQILIVPLHHPVILAKSIATASVISNGRLSVGVGIGWMRRNFESSESTFGVVLLEWTNAS